MVIPINDVICFANKSQKFDIRIIARQLAAEVPKELPSREGKPVWAEGWLFHERIQGSKGVSSTQPLTRT